MQKYKNDKKVKTYEENPYSGICVASVIIAIISFALMRLLHLITKHDLFTLENSIHLGFTAAVVSPMFMWLSVYKEVKRYEMYERGIGEYRYRVPISILVNKGYLYINSKNIFLVFASKRPHFISSMKITDVQGIMLYDGCYVCIRIKGGTASSAYDIKFKIDGDVQQTIREINNSFPGLVENRNHSTKEQ